MWSNDCVAMSFSTKKLMLKTSTRKNIRTPTYERSCMFENKTNEIMIGPEGYRNQK